MRQDPGDYLYVVESNVAPTSKYNIAIDRSDAKSPEDSLRFLTKRGRRRAKAAARGMAFLGIDADLVLSSPFTRTTALEEGAAAEQLGVVRVRHDGQDVQGLAHCRLLDGVLGTRRGRPTEGEPEGCERPEGPSTSGSRPP